MYLRIVDETPDGITVRGAKAHTSFGPNCDEVLVLPTRAMRAQDSDWAVSFAVPANTPGLSLYISPFTSGEQHPWERPISARHKMLETLTVFEDVFVPWDRVFLCREPQVSGPLALAFVDFHRFTAVSYKLPLLDALVGAAAEIARMNGVARRRPHPRQADPPRHLRGDSALAHRERRPTRASRRTGHLPSRLDDHESGEVHLRDGLSRRDPDRAGVRGGLLVTGPGGEDWDVPEIRPVLEKYLGAAAPASERLAMINMIADLTVADFGGYQSVLAVHAEGSIEAEKMQILREYEAARAVGRARWLAGLDDQPGW